MANPKARWEKGTPETQARMAGLAAKAKEAREAAKVVAPASSKSVKPFVVAGGASSVDVNEFTGTMRGFPQTSFGPNFLGEAKTQAWPGDKVE